MQDAAQKKIGAYFYIDTADEIDEDDIPAFMEKKQNNERKKADKEKKKHDKRKAKK